LKSFSRLMRHGNALDDYEHTGILYEWAREEAYLAVDTVRYKGISGVVLYYQNPPVHQIGTNALYAFHEGLDRIIQELDHLDYFILCGPNDPVHTGGDLKESLRKLKKSLRTKAEMERMGGSARDLDRLFSWGEARLEKGILLYHKIRRIAQKGRVVGVCGGGLRFGGSAEIQLMCDVLVGDSRSGMCFSEAMIGIIPGWAGMARVLTKAGPVNAEYVTKTARVVGAEALKQIGVYNDVVTVELPFPQKAGKDLQDYRRLLEEHDYRTGCLLLPRAMELATCKKALIPSNNGKNRKTLATRQDIAREVATRISPDHYAHIRNRPLRDVQTEIERLGRPLAPQSIEALDGLLRNPALSPYNETLFVREELKADAALYRDPKFIVGLKAMLEQRVPDFREQ
jgi:enoyl-CoA hydratase/carnithine racemase